MTLLVEGQPVSLLALLGLGAVVGYIAGIFGVGGGFLLTPMLTVFLGVPPAIAVGSGLCQMIGTAVVTFLRRRSARQGEPRFDLFMMGGSLLGVDAGSRLLVALSNAGEVVFLGRPRPLVVLVAEGLFAAVLLGVGGGVLLLPVLVHGFGFSIRHAAGTGIVVLLASSCVGTFLNALRGNVHLGVVLPLLVASSLSAQLGARLSRCLPARTMRRGFAALTLLTVGVLLWHLLR